MTDASNRSGASRPSSALAPVLGARRDGNETVDSAPGLLMTVLGELVMPTGGAAWTQSLVAIMGELGVQEKATRQAIARMHDRGWLTKTRVGRQTRWELADSATDLLRDGAERIYGFGRHGRPWDGSWLVLLASVPERDRAVRSRMGVGLSWAGFGSLGQGVWISPWEDQEAAAAELFSELNLEATSFRSRLGELGSGRQLVERAWDLPALHARYESFLADRAHLGDTSTGGCAAAELVDLVHSWRRFPFLDPDLPADLLPADWPGAAAALRFAEMRRARLGEVTTWWTETEARFSPAPN